MTNALAGRTALVTGASGGLGGYIARALADAGASLILTGQHAERLAAIARECGGAETLVADLAQSTDRAVLAERAAHADILVNNAAFEVPIRLHDLTEAEVQQHLQVNLMAPIDLTRRLLPGMLSRGRGSIVNISSMSGKSASPYLTVYAATKFGLNGFAMSLREELAGTGVHAGVVCPSFVAKAGMWAAAGLLPPPMVQEVAPERIGRAVLNVIGGASEVLVTPGPVRPLLALDVIFPTLEARVLRALGVFKVLKERADLVTARRVL